MDFTVDQFLAMFHRYNEAIWPMQIVGYVLGLVIVVALVARVRGSRTALAAHAVADRLVPALLAFYWAWIGVVFMWSYQADLSRSGRPFGALFLIGAAAFVVAALRGADLGLGRVPSWRLAVGGAMIAYGMVVYPLLGALAGHSYPSAPVFGVAPCPTTIFTFGVLVCCLRPRWYLLVMPLVWAGIATTAALKLGMVEDFGLVASAVVAAVVVFWMGRQRQGVGRTATAAHGA